MCAVESKSISLYQLVGGGMSSSDFYASDLIEIMKKIRFSSKEKNRLFYWLEELMFWEEYSKIYSNLEKAGPYRSLSKSIFEMIQPGPGEKWLDVGCGPLRVSELIFKKSKGKVDSIEAIDIILKMAKDKIGKLKEKGVELPVHLNYASITDPLPYPDNSFNGVGANLILSYVIDFLGEKGRDALRKVLEEVFRVLAPGGQLLWTTPKEGVNFTWVFLGSIPDMLNLYEYIVHKDIGRILQGTRILKHALEIQKKGKNGIYVFLPKEELESLLKDVGFINLTWKKTFAQQVWVNSAYKP